MASIDESSKQPESLSAPSPIRPEHDTSDFDCGEPALDDWLRRRALDNESRFSRTYVVCQATRVVGYYCISASGVERRSVPGKLRRNAPDLVPVAVIGRLAVSRSHAGRGLGGDLLADALLRIATASDIMGIAAVLVHAKSDAAKNFYLRYAAFLEFPADSRSLFLPVDRIIAERTPTQR